jgi:hypothetical protein
LAVFFVFLMGFLKAHLARLFCPFPNRNKFQKKIIFLLTGIISGTKLCGQKWLRVVKCV